MSEFNINKIAADASASLVKDFCKSAFDGAAAPIKKNIRKITTDFETYLSACYKKNKYVRILSNKATPLELDDIYVSGQFRCRDQVMSDQEVMQRVRDGEKIIVKGDGGLGKTFFVKKLWGAIFDNRQGRVPVFLSLRDLNELSDLDLTSFIRGTIMPNITFAEETFAHFCKEGLFIFIFDGFDEVVEAKRQALQSQLMNLSSQYDKCGFLISSRETDNFNAWDSFYEYRVVRFDRQRTLELLGNIPYEEATKAKFLGKISQSYFDKNASFLSNPLLAIMMLMTFHDNAKIPTKMSMFYENAFQTLYSLHDGLKGAFLRERELDKDNFRRLFSVFCLFSYYSETTSFNDGELRDHVQKSLEYLSLTATIDKVIKEFVESTNLLQVEGLQYTFIHRSFQEYFAAYCATKIITTNVRSFLEHFYNRRFDESFNLAYEIHPNLVEKELIVPFGNTFVKAGGFPKAVSNTKLPYFFWHANQIKIIIHTGMSFKDNVFTEVTSYTLRLSGGELYNFIRTFCELYDSGELLNAYEQATINLLEKSDSLFDEFVDSLKPTSKLIEMIRKDEKDYSRHTVGLAMVLDVKKSSVAVSNDNYLQYDEALIAPPIKKITEEMIEVNEALKKIHKFIRLKLIELEEESINRRKSLDDLIGVNTFDE